MSTLGSISGGSSYWPWFGALPSVGGETTVYGSLLSSVSDSPWLSVSEKERIEELLLSGSLIIPPPQINLASYQALALNFADHFGIGLVGAATGLTGFGIVEGAITLAAFGAWARAQSAESDLSRAFLSERDKNPLEVGLTEYINHSQIRSVDALAIQLLIRQMIALQSLLKTVSPDTVLKAFLLAQQQLIIAFLQKWSEAQSQLAELQKENMIKLDIQNAEKMRQLLAQYIKTALINQEGIKQPILSILFGSIFLDSSTTATITDLLPIFSSNSVAGIPVSLAGDLSILASGLIASTLMWASPIAIAITMQPLGVSDTQVLKDAAKAFALTLASLINNPEFDKLLTATVQQAVASGLIPQSKAETISATFKASLLLIGMALLYKSNLGGVSGKELRAILTGEITVGENDFLGVLAKLIKEQLAKVDAADRDKLLDELLAPYDQSLSLEALLSPLSCFVSGWNPECIRASILANHG